MGQISLNLEDCMRVLKGDSEDADARIIAACGVALLELKAHAEDADRISLSIVHKVTRLAQAEIFQALDQLIEEER